MSDHTERRFLNVEVEEETEVKHLRQRRTYQPQRVTQQRVGDPTEPLDDYSGYSTFQGAITPTTDSTAPFGSDALLVEDDGSGSGARAVRSFGTAQDWSNCGITLPVRWERPTGDPHLHMIVFDTNGNRLRLAASAYSNRPNDRQGWMMAEMAIYEELDGVEVDLTAVDEFHVLYANDVGATVEYYIQHPLLAPYPQQRGGVLLTLDDGHETWMTEGLDSLDRYGHPALAMPISTNVGPEGQLTRADLETLHDRGVTVGCHPQRPDPLTSMDLEEARDVIATEQRFVSKLVGDPSTRFMSWPYGMSDPALEAVARDYHSMAFNGADETGAVAGWRASAPLEVARTRFDSLSDLTNAARLAETYNRLLVAQLHTFDSSQSTGGTNLQPADFDAFLDDVAGRALDVVPPETVFAARTNPGA